MFVIARLNQDPSYLKTKIFQEMIAAFSTQLD